MVVYYREKNTPFAGQNGAFFSKIELPFRRAWIPVAARVLLVADDHLFRVDDLVVDHQGIGVHTGR